VQPDGSVAVVRWSDLTVGSVVLLLCDDAVPADITLVACGGIQGPTAYVETAAIDGESNLKIK
jgi:magnesium-transporting ATPase (P-type)